ncbi:MAG: MCE family protein [Bradymonadaceae bacterium]|nr:MCE family protein [Lujinxingiaceae bacterium]
MQKKETAIEVKVGALVLFSLSLLVAFVLILGDFSFRDGFEFHVQFDNAGGLKPGADVAIAGINVGSVSSLKFIQNENPGASGLTAVAVQVTIRLDNRYTEAVRHDSKFYITTRGLLGEPYIEVATNSLDGKIVSAGDTLRGVDPPRMELIIAKAADLLDIFIALLDNPDIEIKDLIANTASLMKNVDSLIIDNRDNLDASIDGVRITTAEAGKLLATINTTVGEGEQLRTIFNDTQATVKNARSVSAKLDNTLSPLLADASATAKSARRVGETAERVLADKEDKLTRSIDNVHASTESLLTLSGDAQKVIDRVNSGEGTVGALLAEREIYEDMKEVLRIIKQQPWKILWKE